MKKISMRVISLLTVLCMLFLSGCQGQSVKTETAEEFWARPHEWQTQQLCEGNSNEYGYFFVGEHSILKYFDYKTKQVVALCNKVGCKHDDFNCEAFIEGFSPYIFFLEEKMCLITDDENGMHIYRCDLDATNREDKILLMKDEMEKGNAVGITNVLINSDDLYYVAVYQGQPEGTDDKMPPPIKAVRHVDLKTWKEEEICRSAEKRYGVLCADEGGALIVNIPDSYVASNVDIDKFSDEEREEGVMILTLEDMEKLSVRAFYWNKKSGNELTLYESSYRETALFAAIDGNCIFMVGRPDGFKTMGLEKMNMLTGESEWLWHEKERYCVNGATERNGHIYVHILDEDEMVGWEEVYTKSGFQKVELPFMKGGDGVAFEDEHGYVVWTTEEAPDEDGNYRGVASIFVPAEEADKEKPSYVFLEDLS